VGGTARAFRRRRAVAWIRWRHLAAWDATADPVWDARRAEAGQLWGHTARSVHRWSPRGTACLARRISGKSLGKPARRRGPHAPGTRTNLTLSWESRGATGFRRASGRSTCGNRERCPAADDRRASRGRESVDWDPPESAGPVDALGRSGIQAQRGWNRPTQGARGRSTRSLAADGSAGTAAGSDRADLTPVQRPCHVNGHTAEVAPFRGIPKERDGSAATMA